jgi:hypothetical protein
MQSVAESDLVHACMLLNQSTELLTYNGHIPAAETVPATPMQLCKRGFRGFLRKVG